MDVPVSVYFYSEYPKVWRNNSNIFFIWQSATYVRNKDDETIAVFRHYGKNTKR